MKSLCYYSALGVDVNASASEIRAAYSVALARIRKRLNTGKPPPIERLDEISNAYRILISPEQRQIYDEQRVREAVSASSQDVPPVLNDTPSTSADALQEARVEFRGSGEEYFRIWLVNIALTLLTLGIYSAWAKVRREQYFHRNMIVDGSAFVYHGKPRAILFGRIVLMLFFLLVSFAENIGSIAKLAIFLLGAASFPWLMVQSMRFRARNTSYRGIRFSFSGTYLQVLILFLFHGGLCLLTLGLYFPAFLQKQKAFIASHLSFGNTPVGFTAGIGPFYRGLLFPLILWCLFLMTFAAMTLGGGTSKAFVALLLYGFIFLGLLMIFMQFVLFPYARVVGTNLLWNHLNVGQTRFHSTQKIRSYLGITLSNWALTLLTLGLFWPLGQIRMAHFRARNLIIVAPHFLSDASASEQHETSALGSETMSAIDFDIAL